MKISKSDLSRMFPRAIPAWQKAMLELAPVLAPHYKMNRLDWCHFCGQIEAETRGLALRRMKENMTFTTSRRILQVYSYRLGVFIRKDGTVHGRSFSSRTALARYLVRKPETLADIVYGGREGTPWMQGSLYVGRGPFQTTHRNNYREVAAEIRRQPGSEKVPNLVDYPDTLSDDPEMGVRAAFAEWKLKGLSRWARKDDVWSVSKILNTGSRTNKVKPHGLNRRIRGTAKAKAIWTVTWDLQPADRRPVVKPDMILEVGESGDMVRDLQIRLHEKGYFAGKIDGVFGDLTRRAVQSFQSEHGLKIDGKADWNEGSPFREALLATAPIDLGEREKVTTKKLRKEGSRVIKRFDFFDRLAKMWSAIVAALGLDKLFEFGAFETAVSQAEKVKGLGDRVNALTGFDIPYQWIGIAALLGLGLWAWRVASQGKAARVEDSQTGKHLGRL